MQQQQQHQHQQLASFFTQPASTRIDLFAVLDVLTRYIGDTSLLSVCYRCCFFASDEWLPEKNAIREQAFAATFAKPKQHGVAPMSRIERNPLERKICTELVVSLTENVTDLSEACDQQLLGALGRRSAVSPSFPPVVYGGAQQ